MGGLWFLDVSMSNEPLNLDSSERKLDFRVDDNEWNGLWFLDVSMPNGPLNLDSSERKLDFRVDDNECEKSSGPLLGLIVMSH
jgi:hypothetical protein